MGHHCPSCDSKDVIVDVGKEHTADVDPSITLVTVLIACKKCGFGFNCLGTRKA